MVKRQHEALNVLHKINVSSEEGKFVDTCLELEDLKAACLQQGESSKWYSRYLELGQLKYITRFVSLQKATLTTCSCVVSYIKPGYRNVKMSSERRVCNHPANKTSMHYWRFGYVRNM